MSKTEVKGPAKFLPEARGIAAACWCEPDTENTVVDVQLAEIFADKLAAWMYIYNEEVKNKEYYRNLVIECGKHIGKEALRADDGSIMQDILCAKVPGLVAKLVQEIEEFRKL